MSRQRKHVADDVLSASPLPTESLRVARVVESRGSNILEVEFESGESILATFPARYTKKIWIKRGDFVMVEQADLRASGKVVGVITSVIRDDQIRHIKEHGLWYVHGTDAALCVCSRSGPDCRHSGRPAAFETRDCKTDPTSSEHDELSQNGAGSHEDSDGSSSDDEELASNPNHTLVADDSSSDEDDDDDDDDDDDAGHDTARHESE